MSNTARFNRIAKARGSAATRARSSRIRGPTHGCQGLATSQRRFGNNSTQIIRGTDLHNLNQRGELALLHAQLEATLDIIIQQTYGDDSHNFDMPMGCDYANSRPLAEDDGDSDWLEENEIENEAEKLISQMKRVAGHENHREDYRTRRDRTERQWKHWEPQRKAMVDSYMAWSYRKNDSSAPAEDQTIQGEMGITVIDLFGKNSTIVVWPR